MPVTNNPDFESNRITIGFHYVDTLGNTYDSSSTVEVFFDLGESELDVIGRQLNAFLKQSGYARNNDYILMEDLTEEEQDELIYRLDEYRSGKDENED